jgi:phosphohistidine phosphatase SixA
MAGPKLQAPRDLRSTKKSSAALGPFQDLLARAVAEQIVCVGHEPVLTDFMLELTSMRAAETPSLRKGGFYGIRLSKGGDATLEWMVAPAVVLGGS